MQQDPRSTIPRFRAKLATGAVAAALIACVGMAAAAPKPVQLPRSGEYRGHADEGGDVSVFIQGKSVEIVPFQFDCDGAVGSTNLQDFDLEKTDRGWRFRIRAHSSVGYSDDPYYPPENAAIAISGRFTRSGKRVSGTLRVDAPRCDTGRIEWRAHRA